MMMKEQEQVLDDLSEILEQIEVLRAHVQDLIDYVAVATYQADELNFDND